MSIPRDYAMTSEWTRVLLGSFQFSTSFYNGTNEVVYISISDSPTINSSFELAVGEYFNTPTPVFSAYAQGSNTSTGALVVSSFSGINLIDVVLQDGGAWFDNDPWYDEAFAYDGVSFAIPIFQTDRIDIQITGSRMDITGDSVAQRFVTSNPVIDTATGSVFVFQFDTDMDSQDNPLIRMHSTTGFLGPPMDDYLEFNLSITRFLSNLINGGKVQDATTTGTFSGTIVIDTDSKTMGLYRESTGGDNGDLIEQFTYDQQGSLTNTFLHLGVYCTTTADAGNYFEFFLDKTLMPYSLTASDLGIKLAANPDWLQVGEEEEEAESRYFYRLHGDLTSSDAVIETYERLIPDPSVDDFFIGFELVGDIPTDPSYVVSQNFSLDVADREFYIYVSGGLFTFQIGVGGVAFTTGQIVEEGAFKLSFIGTTYTILRDGVQVETGTFVRGSGIEPTATFVIGARHHTNLNAYTFVYDGIIANVNVNGTNFYAIDDNDANLVDSVGGKDAFIRNEVPSNWLLLGGGELPYVAPLFVNRTAVPATITGTRIDFLSDDNIQVIGTEGTVVDFSSGNVFVYQFDTDIGGSSSINTMYGSTDSAAAPVMGDVLRLDQFNYRFVSNLISGGLIIGTTNTLRQSGTVIYDTGTGTAMLYDNLGALITSFSYGTITDNSMYLVLKIALGSGATGKFFEYFLDKTLMPYDLSAGALGVFLAANPDWLQVGEV